ncbi:MAG: efflux transporter periplasmic adaptor subunit [Betaproteobacteria bacterium HGW-Betaproteobacteria-22]|nr:MAG: efflux transporter periplasmic adaptor subunit [Betaproteobacteria bacterium HGW-Betaproteobacteria-22]
MKKLLWILFLLPVACDQPPQPPQPPRPALVMAVGNVKFDNAMTLVGEVLPRYESGQGFRLGGKIISRQLDVGALVKKGQVIASLDATDSRLVTLAALADVHAAEANHNLALAQLERQRQLFAKKFISASALDGHVATYRAASAKLNQVKAQADIAKNQMHYTELIAERDGVVIWIKAEPGQVVHAGEVVVKIAHLNETEVQVAVPESRMHLVAINAPVTVKMWADSEKSYVGKVREIAPAADTATRAFNVRITLQNTDAAIRLGMTAGVRFDEANQQGVTGFLIPSTALTKVGDRKIVWVIDADNRAQPREVLAGDFSESGVWVKKGLQLGEKIAIAGVHTLTKNQLIKPIIQPLP